MTVNLCTDLALDDVQGSSDVVRHTRSDDLEEHTRQLLDWNLEYDQLDGGRFEGRFLDVRLPGLQLFMEGTSRRLLQSGVLSAKSVGFAVMLGGQGDLIVNGVRPGPGGLAAVHDGELEMTSPVNCTLAGVLVDELLLQQASHDLLGRPIDLRKGMVTGLAAGHSQVAPLVSALRSGLLLATTAADALVSVDTQHELRDNILVNLVQVLAGARDADAQGRASQRKWLVDRACELMIVRADEPPSLDVLCNALGTSSRKLNYCFQDVLGMSPHKYIKALRLNAARRELRRCTDPQRSVYDVAVRWGFWHFGRFSCDYKRHFCESPSQSLRRARISSARALTA